VRQAKVTASLGRGRDLRAVARVPHVGEQQRLRRLAAGVDAQALPRPVADADVDVVGPHVRARRDRLREVDARPLRLGDRALLDLEVDDQPLDVGLVEQPDVGLDLQHPPGRARAVRVLTDRQDDPGHPHRVAGPRVARQRPPASATSKPAQALHRIAEPPRCTTTLRL
jgi:hypothetical protein